MFYLNPILVGFLLFVGDRNLTRFNPSFTAQKGKWWECSLVFLLLELFLLVLLTGALPAPAPFPSQCSRPYTAVYCRVECLCHSLPNSNLPISIYNGVSREKTPSLREITFQLLNKQKSHSSGYEIRRLGKPSSVIPGNLKSVESQI